ncbi:MAG: glycosyltransferase, partial [Chloroflexota bacterium]
RLKALAGSLGLGGSVTFRGLVPQEDLPDYYRAADVSVVPSYYESFSLVALESLACGTPVVATDVGDLRSIIRDGETGDVVSDNQPHHLADKIARRLARPRPDRAAALAIRATVAPLGWSNIAQAVMRESRRIPGPHLARVL